MKQGFEEPVIEFIRMEGDIITRSTGDVASEGTTIIVPNNP